MAGDALLSDIRMSGPHAVELFFGLNVPAIFAKSCSHGVMVMEQLNGDMHGSFSLINQAAASKVEDGAAFHFPAPFRENFIEKCPKLVQVS
jgi:hypothetical protein